MLSSLQHLFATIDRIEHESDLRSQLLPQIGEHFRATRRGIFYFDNVAQTLGARFSLIDSQIEKVLQLALSIEHNPIARYIVEHHAPVHEALVTSPKVWTTICPRPDHWHVMAGPIVSHGRLVGVVGCMPAFDGQNLTDLSAVCLHLSVWTATMRTDCRLRQQSPIGSGKLPLPPFTTARLTPRELQIAKLVALGQTNAEIGRELWITENSVKQALKRMFRKLDVSSRAEMVAQLLQPESTMI
jgi:DNA-binding CsgD family transcriptional regulator